MRWSLRQRAEPASTAPMPQDPRLDPEMAAFTEMMTARAADYPPQSLVRPLDASRAGFDLDAIRARGREALEARRHDGNDAA